jgi:hypothetical protein
VEDPSGIVRRVLRHAGPPSRCHVRAPHRPAALAAIIHLQPFTPPHPGLPAVDLQGQHLDLIDRYVHRRIPDPRQAERVVRDLFQKAGANPAQVQANPLPWLIAAARRAGAQVRRANPIKS